MNTFHLESKLTSITVTHDIEEAVVLGEKILVLRNSSNRTPEVFDNRHFAARDQRTSPEFLERCGELREMLAHRTLGGR